jgi:hypothetical protein
MSSNNSPFDQSSVQGPPLSGVTSSELLGVYEHSGIGMEFIPPAASMKRTREHEARRSKQQLETWKEISSQSDSQRIPKSSLRKACQYENSRAFSDSLVTWSVFFVLASLAGIIGGLAITHFAF